MVKVYITSIFLINVLKQIVVNGHGVRLGDNNINSYIRYICTIHCYVYRLLNNQCCVDHQYDAVISRCKVLIASIQYLINYISLT